MSFFTSIVNFFKSLFGKKTTTPAPTPAPTPSVQAPTFVDNFATLDLTKWTVSNWDAPSFSSTNGNTGTFATGQVSIVDGMLCLKLTQTKNADGTFTSVGGEITSVQNFGYGTYQFVVRTSTSSSTPTGTGSAVSGSVTGCFSYATNSVTEIDVEVEGIAARSALAQFTSWHLTANPNQETQTTVTPTPDTAFYTYKYVWNATSIAFYVNNVLVSTHTTVVPTTPAQFLFNHYGMNDSNWGGLATVGDRFMYVKNFTFTAA